MTVSSLDRSSPPPARELRPVDFPSPGRHRLANGLELYLLPRRRFPLLRMTLVCRGGAGDGPIDTPGLVTLTAALLDEGSTRHSGPEIATLLERLGGSLSTSADWNAVRISAAVLPRDLGVAIGLLADAVLRPTFPEAELDRLRQLALAELLRRRDQPAALADDALLRDLYQGAPEAFPLLGEETALHAIDRDAVVAQAAASLSPERSALVLVGDFAEEAALGTVEAELGGWLPAARAPEKRALAQSKTSLSIRLLDRPQATQTELRMGHVAVPRNHPDRPALAVLNGILGGKFTSRINLNLRERLGLTYGAFTRFVDRRAAGPFLAGAAVSTEGAGRAVEETLGEIARIREHEVDAHELEETVSYLVGVYPYTLRTSGDLAARLDELAVFELPDDHPARHLAALRAVTREEVLRVARLHLHPEGLTVVAVGPAAELRPQLEPIAPIVEE